MRAALLVEWPRPNRLAVVRSLQGIGATKSLVERQYALLKQERAGGHNTAPAHVFTNNGDCEQDQTIDSSTDSLDAERSA